jgi:hypothetical protein
MSGCFHGHLPLRVEALVPEYLLHQEGLLGLPYHMRSAEGRLLQMTM